MAGKITKKEEKELAQLYHEAEGVYLEAHNFNAVEWVPDESLPRFRELYKKQNGFCPDSSCGDCESCNGDI
jgi:hypothetical protein